MQPMTEPRWKPSVTVAAVVEQDGRFLLVEEMTPDGLKLNNPAGHLDPGEAPAQGAARECLEETTCTFTPQWLLGVYLARLQRPAVDGGPDEDITYLRFAYGGSVGAPDTTRTLDAPVVRTLWMTPGEVRASAARHRSPLVQRCIDDHLAGRRYALDTVTTHDSVALLPLPQGGRGLG